jgi:peroxiredoxin
MTDDTHDNAAPAPFTGGPDQAAGHAGAAGSTGSTQPPPLPQDAPPPGRRRWIVAAMGALAVALFTVPLLLGPGADAPAPATSASGSAGTCSASKGKANLDFTLKDVNGADVRLSDYKGKVILLNFWATWCGPCRVEIPEFVEVYREYRDRGFEILGVLAQDEPSREELNAFTSTYKVNYPILRANEDFENANGSLYALPTTFLIDRQGSICLKHMGPFTREMVEREIKGLL